MGTRGRESSASLGVVPLGPKPRMAPPDELTPDQAVIWRNVAGTKPPDWWAADSAPLLVLYSQVVTDARKIERLIARFDVDTIEDGNGVAEFDRLLAMRARHAAVIAMLATKMRLAQQSRYDLLKAGRVQRTAATGAKPWQRASGE